MKFNKKFPFDIAPAFLVASFVPVFSGQGFLRRPELGGAGILFRLRGNTSYNPNNIAIEIDDDDATKAG
ncbi:MAG: hypothetical protein HQ594_02930 [Candidatus Omnitrophica bacterium]|nr:hypothetical protein [Candidatus Omnitrophota bacterium]